MMRLESNAPDIPKIFAEQMMTTIAVVFQSGRGHTKALAEAMLKDITQVPGVEGKLFEISGKE